jgi:hypothetical protein
LSLRGRPPGGAVWLPRLRRAVLLGLRGSAGIGRVLPSLRDRATGRDRDAEVRIVRAVLNAGVDKPDDR